MADLGDVRVVVANDAATKEPHSDSGAKTDITIMTWNIVDARGGGLEAAARAARSINANIVVLQETKVSLLRYTKRHFGYKIKATDVGDNRFGGVAVLYEESKLYKVEEAKARGPNVMTFEVFTGSKHYFVVGGYIPPSETTGKTLQTIDRAMKGRPKGSIPIFLGDLNVNLDHPRNDKEIEVTEVIDSYGFSCATCDFTQRRGPRIKGRWSYRKKRGNRNI